MIQVYGAKTDKVKPQGLDLIKNYRMVTLQ